MLNLIAMDLQLYKIFKITQVSFFGPQCILFTYDKGICLAVCEITQKGVRGFG